MIEYNGVKYYFNFPEDWDRNNVLALRQYEKCAPRFQNIEEFKNIYTRSIFYHLLAIFLIIYSIISIFLIINNKSNYDVLKLNKTSMLIYACSGLVCIVNCYCRNVCHHKQFYIP